MTKWVDRDRRRRAHARDSSRAPSTSRMQGRPGPVVIALPEDMLTERRRGVERRALEPVETWPGRSRDGRAAEALWRGRAPDRGAGRRRAGRGRLRRDAPLRRALRLPVGDVVPPRAMLFRRAHPNYAGDLGLGPNPEADGADQGRRSRPARRRPHGGDAVAGLYAVRHSRPRQQLVHVHAERRGTRPGLPPASRHQCHAAGLLPPRRSAAAGGPAAGRETAQQAHAEYLAWTEAPTRSPGAVNLGEVMVWLRERLPRGRDRRQRRRQLRRLGRSASSASAASARSSRRPRARWATACPQPWACKRALSRIAWSSASPATATS